MLKIILASLFTATLVNAWSCFEPAKPGCVEFGFNTSVDFEHCKSEVEDYLQKSQDYIQCLQNNINNAANEANEVVKQFNCKASGKSYCY